ncbi:ComEC/Rec2 family competence protein [Streptomyces sp. TS71-3]|uniref:ComEC/Rec2 family competence protein n=1 Tax=Streptomyces sp. TS71-3 TaxID=2733862 RepID=UPI0020175E51|nr:ComEC/Rec2 family competence protein [Streptomyces sp. TS71-3]
MALHAGPRWTVPLVVVSLLLAAALALLARRAERGARQSRERRRTWLRVSATATLLCVAASASSAALHGADLRRGPIPALARGYARVTVDVEVTSDPHRTRPRVTGDHMARTVIVFDARAVRVTTADGTARATRTPVLVIADAPAPRTAGERAAGDPHAPPQSPSQPSPPSPSGARGAVAHQPAGAGPPGTGETVSPAEAAPSDGTVPPVETSPAEAAPLDGTAPSDDTAPQAVTARASPWERLLPTTRVRVRARLAPPLSGDDRIAAVVRVGGGGPPEVVRKPSAPQRLAGRLRAGLRTATQDLAPDARALLPGLVVGDTSRVPPELHEAFDATDLTHVLAVSGANFTILLALLIGPPGLAQRAERRGLAPRLGIGLRATALLGGVLAIGFVVVCRPEPSVLRAAACGGIALLAIATGRRRSLVPALAAVVLMLVLYDPWLARSYGFLLSVLATGALLTLAPGWAEALRGRGVPPRVAEALAAAAAAQVVCAPVLVVLASRVSLVAVPCNLLAEFAVAPATVLGFGALVAAPVAMPVARVFAWCAGWPAGWLADVARTGADLPGAGVDWPGGWLGALLLLAVGVAVVAAGRKLIRHPWVSLICLCALLLFVLQPRPLPRVLSGWPPPGWRFVMCDVGQGDATVLAAGDGTAVVVDAGPDPVLVDHCLRRLGVTRVRMVLLTHFHADHVAGLPGVLHGRDVGAIETTGFREPLGEAESVRRAAEARHIPVTQAVAGERRRTGSLEWQVLWPPPRPAPGPDSPNDASVALMVRTGGLRLLLLGDLEPLAQQALLASPSGAGLGHVDVLKVAHHGSAYQDPLLIRTVSPRLALISCGTNNPYGHPSPRTVAALQAGGAKVLRTDRDGSLAVVGTAGSGLKVAESPESPW